MGKQSKNRDTVPLMIGNGAIRAAVTALVLAVLSLSLGAPQTAQAQAFPQIPGTEDFSSDALKGTPTTAEWDSTAPDVLRLPLSTSTPAVQSLTGAFSVATTSSTIDAGDLVSTRAVAAGDLNGDGFVDLAFGNDGRNTVYFNDQSGGFVRGPTIPDDFQFGNTRSAVIADLNGDGHLDVVFAEFGGGQATRVHFNNGSGTTNVFDAGDFVDLGAPALKGDSLAAGDLDDDGDTDIVLGVSGNHVQVFINDGYGNFSSGMSVVDGSVLSFGFHARSVALGDLDLDGDLDIVAAQETGTTRIYLNDGSAGFTTGQSAAGGAINKLSAPDSIALGDLNGDGRLDLIIGNDSTDSDIDGDGDPTTNPGLPNRIYFGGPVVNDLFPAVSFEFADVAVTDAVRVADLDRDGDLDIVTGDLINFDNGDVNRLYTNDGSGNFPANGTAITADVNRTKSIAVSDVDADGALDLVVANDPDALVPGSGFNQVVINDGTLSGTPANQLFATAVSQRVDNGESFANGLILTTTDSSSFANPMFSYWMSSNGGLTWVAVQPGRSIRFPSPVGSDLRWRIDMSTLSPNSLWSTRIFTLSITGNRAPSFTSTPVTTATEDLLYTYAITATDPDGETVEIRATTALPAWLTLTDSGDGTATLEGTPANADVGDNAVELEVVDGAGRFSAQSFTIAVANVNNPPTVVAPTGDQTFDQGTDVNLDASLAFEDIDVGDVLSYSATGLPASLSIDAASGVITGTITNDDVVNGPDYAVTVTADDGNGGTVDDSFTITITNLNDPPEFTSTPVTSATAGQSYTYNVTTSDADGDLVAITSNALPAWLNLVDNNDGTATLSGTPGAGDAGNVDVTLTADDSVDQATQAFTIVVGAANTAPSISVTGDNPVEIEVGSGYTDAGATASDIEDGDLSGSIVTDNPVDPDTIGTYTVTYTVTDSGGLMATATRTVNVVAVNTAPTISINGSATVQITVGDGYTDAGATASDAEDGDLTSQIAVDNPVDANSAGTYTVTYTVTDSGGLSATATRTVTVVAATPPPPPPPPPSSGGGGSLGITFLMALAGLAIGRRRRRY